jgi:hypothetical protein
MIGDEIERTAGGGNGCGALRSLAIVAILLSALVASHRAAAAVPDLTSRRSHSSRWSCER